MPNKRAMKKNMRKGRALKETAPLELTQDELEELKGKPQKRYVRPPRRPDQFAEVIPDGTHLSAPPVPEHEEFISNLEREQQVSFDRIELEKLIYEIWRWPMRFAYKIPCDIKYQNDMIFAFIREFGYVCYIPISQYFNRLAATHLRETWDLRHPPKKIG